MLASAAAPPLSGPAVSIQTELALEQLQQKHQQELKELHIQLETQVTQTAAAPCEDHGMPD